ncbi:MAG: YkgJ family cysteine cluster protein [Planctomycetes bacterium]|nr:YkgJ family cysteine cluster protein [Planctomycetota bacterium]
MSTNRSSTVTEKTTARGGAVYCLAEPGETLSSAQSEMTVSRIISVFGVQKNISIQILDPEARLSDLVPLARALTDAMVSEAIDRSRQLGKRVVCDRKCAACCSYLVPLSIPEVIHLHDEVQSFSPEQSREFWENSLSVATRLLEGDSSEAVDGESSLDAVGEWYSDKQVACPFLEQDLCAIYDHRPLACREHLVTTPAPACSPEAVGHVEKPELPCSVLEAIGKVAAQLEGTPVEAIMLPLMLPWIQENPDRVQRKWSALEMAQCFMQAMSA